MPVAAIPKVDNHFVHPHPAAVFSQEVWRRQVHSWVGSTSGGLSIVLGAINEVYLLGRMDNRVNLDKFARMDARSARIANSKGFSPGPDARLGFAAATEFANVLDEKFLRQLIHTMSCVVVAVMGGHSLFEMLFTPHLAVYGGNFGKDEGDRVRIFTKEFGSWLWGLGWEMLVGMSFVVVVMRVAFLGFVFSSGFLHDRARISSGQWSFLQHRSSNFVRQKD